MITERRQIIFSTDALRDAVQLYRASYPERIPHGRIHKVWPVGEPETYLVVQIEPLGARRLLDHRMSQREIAACVILYCRKARVPLPRNGNKYLEVDNGMLSLVITQQLTIDEPIKT